LQVRAARAMFNPYCHGILESKLDADSLADGRIRFEKLRAILPSGQEVFIPEGAELPTLDIKPELARGSGSLEVRLAVPLWAKNRENAFKMGEVANPQTKLIYIPKEVVEVADENSGENPQTLFVRKVNARVVLGGAQGEVLSDMESIPLLRIVRSVSDQAGKPRQDPEYVPPALLLKSSPVLHDMMRQLVARLNATRNDLRKKAAAGGHGLEVKWEHTLKLTVLNRFCASLPSVVEEGTVPPFYLYLQLRELLGELLGVHPEKDIFEVESYNHDDSYRVFKDLDQKIRDLIRLSKRKDPIIIDFTGLPGKLRVGLEPMHLEKPAAYYLGVLTRVDRSKLASYLTDLTKFQFMPRSLEDFSSRFGVLLKEESSPSLDLPTDNNPYYFRVVTTSNEKRWDEVKRDKAISLVWNNSDFDLSEAKFRLYMTLTDEAT